MEKYKIIETGGNGNCLFSSIGYFLNKPHDVVRYEIVRKMRKDCFKMIISGVKLCCLIRISENKSISEYCNVMSLSGCMGGEIELFVASILYNTTIEVYDANFKLQYTYPRNTDKIARLRYTNMHYTALV